MLKRQRINGFTLVELVVVILILSIISLVALPRFFNQTSFYEMGFRDDLLSALRYAHKHAIASGCDTSVIVTPASFQLSQRSSCDTGGFTQPVLRPGGDGSGYSGTTPSGVTAGSASLYFDPLGTPREIATGNKQAAVLNITVGARTLAVEPETGFVHLL